MTTGFNSIKIFFLKKCLLVLFFKSHQGEFELNFKRNICFKQEENPLNFWFWTHQNKIFWQLQYFFNIFKIRNFMKTSFPEQSSGWNLLEFFSRNVFSKNKKKLTRSICKVFSHYIVSFLLSQVLCTIIILHHKTHNAAYQASLKVTFLIMPMQLML